MLSPKTILTLTWIATATTSACGFDTLISPTSRPKDCPAPANPAAAYVNYRSTLERLRQSPKLQQTDPAFCLLPPGARASQDPRKTYEDIITQSFDPDVLYAALSDGFGEIISKDKLLGLKRRAQIAWKGTWLSEASLAAYRRTGQERFLDLFTNYYDQVINRRDDRLNRYDAWHKRVMKAWGSTNLTEDADELSHDERWISHITHNARIVLAGTDFALIVRSSPSLRRLQAKADQYTLIAQETLNEFSGDQRTVPGHPEIKWYFRPFQNKYEPTNHIHMVARVWSNLAKLTGKHIYTERVNEVIRVFGQGLQQEPRQFISWNYYPFFVSKKQQADYANGQGYSEPIWKATHTTQFLLKSHQQNNNPPRDTIDAIARILSEHTFQGEQIMRNVAAKGSRPLDPSKDQQNPNIVTLISFAAIEPRLKRQIPQVVAARPDIFPQGWLYPEGLIAYANLLPESSAEPQKRHSVPGSSQRLLTRPLQTKPLHQNSTTQQQNQRNQPASIHQLQ